jgi:hypothetical protein
MALFSCHRGQPIDHPRGDEHFMRGMIAGMRDHFGREPYPHQRAAGARVFARCLPTRSRVPAD